MMDQSIKRTPFFLFVLVIALTMTMAAQVVEKFDTAAVNKIIDEGMNRSQVMELLSWLTDVHGPRLTNSPEYAQAAEWAAAKLREWGLQNVHFDKWGPFGRGWTLKRFSANLTAPRAFPIIAYPKAWTQGLKGTVSADVVYLDAKSEEDLQKYKGQLKGKFVLVSDPRQLTAHFAPEAARFPRFSSFAYGKRRPASRRGAATADAVPQHGANHGSACAAARLDTQSLNSAIHAGSRRSNNPTDACKYWRSTTGAAKIGVRSE